MTFSVFALLMIIIVVLVAFIHMLQGFFSAAISAVLAVFSAVLALSYHEVIVEKFLGGRMADSAHAMILLTLFAAIYLVLRTIFDAAIPGNIRLPSLADKIGGAVMGAVAGLFGAGVVAVAAQEMSFFPSMMGYSRYAVDSVDVVVPNKSKSLDSSVTDQMLSPEFNDADQQKMLLPVDDILVGTTRRLSEGGALSTSDPLSRLHPDWIQEMFGQRAGIEPGARRVLMSTPGFKSREAYTDGVFLVTQSKLPWIDAEFAEIRKSTGRKMTAAPTSGPAAPAGPQTGPPKLPPQFYGPKPNSVLLVVRVRFSHDAAERSAGGLVRVSPGSVRLVTSSDGKAPGEATDYVDHYPVGTLEYRDPRGKTRPKLPHFVMMGQNIDDFIMVSSEPMTDEADYEGGSPADAGVDFVFQIEQANLGWKIPPAQLPTLNVATSELKLPQGAFIEVKRLAREDLSGQKVLPEADLYKKFGSIRVLRKTDQLAKGLLGQGISSPDSTDSASSGDATPTPPTPAPTPAAPPTPAVPAVATFPLDVSDPPDSPKISDRFFTTVGATAPEGPAGVAGASFTLVKSADKSLIQTAKVDGADTRTIRGAGQLQVQSLAAPAGMSLVQVVAKPKDGASDKTWPWKDQLRELALVDADNVKYAPIGVWASYADPAGGPDKLAARYSADGSVPISDLQPGGELKKLWLVFPVKAGAKVKQLVQGSVLVKEQPIDVQ